ncbi:hypothetical protein AA0498_1016 [Acidomonas methanolica]|uniref:Uncharacterized protein n=1 Tax=Acidomonas methanolica NBRC 104435 TaxID=1231351 RepID=A0A023D3Q6_ACIMT|nr:hypothetical protein Amme_023_003 [Acidomonas methanolica NBRC 104435]GBQ49578.1 hypothetical protein AA0498_1016 [Acidomonas methanolica]GEK99235.1 hypothetical protein AME01nite_17340 [Acidomonas methanolica NBRC 104435]
MGAIGDVDRAERLAALQRQTRLDPHDIAPADRSGGGRLEKGSGADLLHLFRFPALWNGKPPPMAPGAAKRNLRRGAGADGRQKIIITVKERIVSLTC